jgi:hypothetical protein
MFYHEGNTSTGKYNATISHFDTLIYARQNIVYLLLLWLYQRMLSIEVAKLSIGSLTFCLLLEWQQRLFFHRQHPIPPSHQVIRLLSSNCH